MPGETVLVIDDDKLSRWSLSTVLRRGGYRVLEAATGEEGLAAVENDVPDLVLLDIMLPDMHGFAVLSAIRQADPKLPVLMMTVDATSQTIRHALQLGARGQLDKPCDAAVLLSAVSDALQAPTPPGEPRD